MAAANFRPSGFHRQHRLIWGWSGFFTTALQAWQPLPIDTLANRNSRITPGMTVAVLVNPYRAIRLSKRPLQFVMVSRRRTTQQSRTVASSILLAEHSLMAFWALPLQHSSWPGFPNLGSVCAPSRCSVQAVGRLCNRYKSGSKTSPISHAASMRLRPARPAPLSWVSILTSDAPGCRRFV